MIPILYEYDTTTFRGHGLGDLTETISCQVRQTDTNEFELELDYPVSGHLFSELKINRIIYAKVNNNTNTTFTIAPQTLPYQAFRIYGFEKEMSGVIHVKAQHISYDLANIYVLPTDKTNSEHYYGRPVTGGSAGYTTALINLINDNIISGTNNFEITAVDDYGYYSEAVAIGSSPRSIRSILFDSNNSLVSNFGGICAYDNFRLKFYSSPSTYVAATIEYGDNLIDLTQEQTISEMYTGILPYYLGTDPRHLEDSSWNGPDSVIFGDIIYADGTFERHNILPVDITSQLTWGTMTEGYDTVYDSYSGKMIWIPDVNYGAQKWVRKNKFGTPDVNVTIDYDNFTTDVNLYNVVKIRFKKLGIDLESRIVTVVYDVLKERNIEVEIGKSKASGAYFSENYFGNEYSGKGR